MKKLNAVTISLTDHSLPGRNLLLKDLLSRIFDERRFYNRQRFVLKLIVALNTVPVTFAFHLAGFSFQPADN
jgi:hypothetical protein